jgi:Uma2 family endonuclease
MRRMATQPLQSKLTADEFLVWAAEQPRGRYELAGGEVVAMPPERVGHARAKFAMATALHGQLSGGPCEVMTDGVSVRIDEGTVYEPDVLVRCGERTSDDVTAISDPILLVEVVSPSSLAVDSGAKLTDYFRLPSLRHYLVVNTGARAIVHHRRDEAGDIGTRVLRDGVLTLDPPGIGVAVGACFAML